MENRRQFVRWELNHAAKLKLEGKAAETDCNVMDISLKGARIALKAKLAVDKFLRMRLILNQDFHLEPEAWVVWHKPLGNQNVYGLYFNRIKDSDKEKIYKFIRRDYSLHARNRILDGLRDPKRQDEISAEGEDKRIFERFAVRLPLRYLSYDATLDGDAETVDISAKGVGFVCGRQFPEGMTLEVWIRVSEKGEPFYARARVAWSKKNPDNTYRAGINLDRVDLMGLSQALKTR